MSHNSWMDSDSHCCCTLLLLFIQGVHVWPCVPVSLFLFADIPIIHKCALVVCQMLWVHWSLPIILTSCWYPFAESSILASFFFFFFPLLTAVMTVLNQLIQISIDLVQSLLNQLQHFNMHWPLLNDLSSLDNINVSNNSILRLFSNIALVSLFRTHSHIHWTVYSCLFLKYNIINLTWVYDQNQSVCQPGLALKSTSYDRNILTSSFSLQDRWYFPFINVTETQWL